VCKAASAKNNKDLLCRESQAQNVVPGLAPDRGRQVGPAGAAELATELPDEAADGRGGQELALPHVPKQVQAGDVLVRAPGQVFQQPERESVAQVQALPLPDHRERRLVEQRAFIREAASTPEIDLPVTDSPAQTRPSAAASELTDREAEVLRLVSAGTPTRQSADRLGIGGEAVGAIKTRAIGRLGLGTRAALVRYASQQGWL
jgi:DNA-binding CsgD family transcriptional regulator